MSVISEAAAEFEALGRANRAFAARYPGERTLRQPTHTVYGGAQLFKAETPSKLGVLALQAFRAHAPDPLEFARVLGFAPTSRLEAPAADSLLAEYASDAEGLRRRAPAAWLIAAVHQRVEKKLEREAVEDYRIDFEDGFGARTDAEEDAVARASARETARALGAGLLPPFIGIRIKSFSEEWKLRGARTLELYLETLLTSAGRLPDNFVITLPKVTLPEQPRTLVRLCELLERKHTLAPGSLRLELMIEAAQALLGPDGYCPLPALLAACQGRCAGVHVGTYDLTASCNITAAHQRMHHPLCELAKGMLTFALAGTGVFLSDGATHVIPVGPHRGAQLSAEQRSENRAVVHAAWRLAHDNIRRSLENGFYQGWDLHPAQLPVRFAATFAFFLEGLAPAAERLRNFVERAARATLVGGFFDDAASGQGLLNFFLRALNSGAIEPHELAQTGLLPEEFALRSFAKIIEARRARLTRPA